MEEQKDLGSYSGGVPANAAQVPCAVGYTPGPWSWLIHDHSAASLGVMPDPGMGDPLVLNCSPCKSCQEHARKAAEEAGTYPEWKWGRCCTPSIEDAHLIAAAPELLEALADLRKYVKRAPYGVLKASDAAIAKALGQ